MDEHKKTGFRVGFNGWFLLVCAVVFICGLVAPIDSQNWSWPRVAWLIINVVVILVLIGLLFSRDAQSDDCEHRHLDKTERAKSEKNKL